MVPPLLLLRSDAQPGHLGDARLIDVRERDELVGPLSRVPGGWVERLERRLTEVG